jgi:hypothetical protein
MKGEATIVSGGGFFPLKGNDTGPKSTPDDGMAASGAFVRISVWEA